MPPEIVPLPSGGSQGGGETQASPDEDRVGRYDLIRRLGSGGMAEVHLARASGIEGFQKLVVLKRILPHLSADPHFVSMFLAEARLAAILEHNNVVQVFDLGRDNQDYYFTMEFVYGETLYSILRTVRKMGKELPIEHAISIGIGAAAGLHYAHERVGFDGKQLGIVHRDVSPTNVMVTYDGCVKVADFGIAKITSRTDVTRAGMRKGKVPYMSPEQCRAAKVDRRSDVFSLGIVLYEASTQSRLFDGDNEFGVMNRIVNGDVELPSARRAGYPKDLENIVMRALSLDKDQRYASARDFQLDLERFARERKLPVSPSSLGDWMHGIFGPQPFPWGALQGGGGRGAAAAAVSTLADSMHMFGSQSGAGLSSSHPGHTPHSSAESWRRLSGASAPGTSGVGALGTGALGTGALGTGVPGTSGAGARTSGGTASGGSKALRGVAIGLGVVAAVSVAGLLGMYLQATLASDDVPSEGTVTPAAAVASPDADSPEDPAEAPAVITEDQPPSEEPLEAAAPGDEEPPEAEPPEAEPLEAVEEPVADEEVLMVEDEPMRRGRKTRSRTKPKAGSGRPKGESKTGSGKTPKSTPAPGKGKGKTDLDTLFPT